MTSSDDTQEIAVEGLQYPTYPEMEEAGHAQLSPLNGLQLQADGTLAPAMEPPPLGATVEEQEAHNLEQQVLPPSMPPQYRDDHQTAALQQLEQQREQLARQAGNVDIKGMPHFERLIDGVSLCGACAETFPCAGWQGLTREQQAQTPGVAPLDASHPDWRLPTMEEAAQAAGLTVQEYMEDLHRRQLTQDR